MPKPKVRLRIEEKRGARDSTSTTEPATSEQLATIHALQQDIKGKVRQLNRLWRWRLAQLFLH